MNPTSISVWLTFLKIILIVGCRCLSRFSCNNSILITTEEILTGTNWRTKRIITVNRLLLRWIALLWSSQITFKILCRCNIQTWVWKLYLELVGPRVANCPDNNPLLLRDFLQNICGQPDLWNMRLILRLQLNSTKGDRNYLITRIAQHFVKE